MTTPRRASLPPTLAPRGLSETEAAAYIGVGVTLFREMVVDGRMPQPKPINSRLIWDRLAVDTSFANLPNVDGDVGGENSLDSYFRKAAR